MNPARARVLLDAARNARILVVGDLMLDRYVTGRVERVSPEAPVPVVRVEARRDAVGGAGNAAANVLALGGRCTVVGCVGDDPAGRTLVEALERLGADAGGVVVSPDRPTTEKTRVLARHQQVARFDVEDDRDVPPEVAARLIQNLRARASDADAIVVADYDKGVLVPDVIDAVRAAAERRGIPWVVDPKRRRFFAYGGATVFKPNLRELQDALGDFAHPDDGEWMETTRRRLGCRHLLLTLGERGMALQTEEGVAVRIPGRAQDVFDVSGAGDTVSATVAVVLAAGGDIVEAAQLANVAASIEVARSGAATVSGSDILRHVAREGAAQPETPDRSDS